jgi:CelD/BcsL family acetyltransferase involved in cellulose biosynthesis
MHPATDASTAAAPGSFADRSGTRADERVVVLRGSDGLTTLAARFDLLCSETATPITARRTWLESWTRVHASRLHLLVAVERGDRLVAAAPLALSTRFGVHVVRPVGDGPSDDVRFPSTDERAAALLARGVKEALDATGRPWLLVVRHLGPGQPTVPALVRALPHSVVMTGDMSPGLALGAERTVRAHLTSSQRKPLERRHRRLRERHPDLAVEHLSAEADIAACFAEVARVSRRRDSAVGRRSQLDQPEFRAFFECVVRGLSRRGEVELTTLRIGGELAAHALCLLDDGARRLWHGRYDPRWDSYAVGHLVNLAALQRALDDPRCQVFDWMRGTEDYKTSLSDHRVQLTDLIAGSPGLAWLVRLLPHAVEGRRAAWRMLRRIRRGWRPLPLPHAPTRHRARGAIPDPSACGSGDRMRRDASPAQEQHVAADLL